MNDYRVDTTVRTTAKCDFKETEKMTIVYRDTFKATSQSNAVSQARDKYPNSDIKSIVCY